MNLVRFSVVTSLLLLAGTANADPFKIGVVAPLSGPLAEYGVALQSGVSMAQADKPELFKECSLTFDDSKYDPKTAISSLQNFIRDHMDVLYNWGGPPSEAVAPVAEAAHVPLFLWTAEPKVSRGKKYVVRFCNNGRDYGAPIAKELRKRKLTHLAMVKAQNQYIDAINTGFEMSLEEDLKVEATESVTPGDLDFKTIISKLKKHPPQALGVFLISGQVSQFYKQLAEQHLSVPTFGTDFFDSVNEVKEARGGMDGAIFTANTVTPDFYKRYVEKYGNDVQITHAGNGYDFALYACGELPKHRGNIAESLKDTTPPNFAQGPSVFVDENGDRYFRFPVALKEINGEKIVEKAQ